MKTPIVIGNWKMKMGLKESLRLAKKLKRTLNKVGNKIEVGVCPSYTSLYSVSVTLVGTKIKLGGQDMFWEEEGAYTGEISPLMLTEYGCRFVILGHSERRHNLGESDKMVHQKVRLALNHHLMPIVCVGEDYEQRQENQTDYVIISQVTKALDGIELKENDRLVIAYEPVWVIGTGQAIEPSEAEHAHNVIYHILLDIFPEEIVKNKIRIIYGGSVDSVNVRSFTDREMIDGVLVGGASLDVEEFTKIVNEVKK